MGRSLLGKRYGSLNEGAAGRLDRNTSPLILNRMVNKSQQLDEAFFALSDPTRRAIVSRLAAGDATVAELAQPFRVSAPAISKHLRILERAGLLRQHREGRTRRCELLVGPLKRADEWVAKHRQFWEVHLDGFAKYVEKREE